MENFCCRAQRLDGQGAVEGYIYEHKPPILCPLGDVESRREPSKWYILQTGFADWNMPRPVEFIPVDPETIEKFRKQGGAYYGRSSNMQKDRRHH